MGDVRRIIDVLIAVSWTMKFSISFLFPLFSHSLVVPVRFARQHALETAPVLRAFNPPNDDQSGSFDALNMTRPMSSNGSRNNGTPSQRRTRWFGKVWEIVWRRKRRSSSSESSGVKRFDATLTSSVTPREKKPKRTKTKAFVQVVSLACALLIVSPVTSGEISQLWSEGLPSFIANYRRSGGAEESSTRTEQHIVSSRSFSDGKGTGSEVNGGAAVQAATTQPTVGQQVDESAINKEIHPPASTPTGMSVEEKRRESLTFVTEAVEKIGPSVLRIDTETQVVPGDGRQFPSAFVQQGQGSGLIFSKEGYVLTNAHVVEGATKVTVTLTDGRIYEAEVKGCDEIVDIAVLKIIRGDKGDVQPLPVAQLGDSDKLQVGQIVVAVGSPGGLDNTVTMGIVSGLERSSTMVGIPHKKVDYIQTDAAINP